MAGDDARGSPRPSRPALAPAAASGDGPPERAAAATGDQDACRGTAPLAVLGMRRTRAVGAIVVTATARQAAAVREVANTPPGLPGPDRRTGPRRRLPGAVPVATRRGRTLAAGPEGDGDEQTNPCAARRLRGPGRPRWRPEALVGAGLAVVVVLAGVGVRALRDSGAPLLGPLPGAQLLPGLSTQWSVFGGNPWQDRFAPERALGPAAAPRLRPAFRVSLPVQGADQEGFPVEAGGRLYVSTAGAGVVALDGATGGVLWTHRGQGTGPNRGVAVAGGRVYVLGTANVLTALQASDGAVLWSVPVAAGLDQAGYFESTAPVVARGMVLFGISGGDNGARGFIEAVSATDGQLLWRFFTVPPAGQGWVPATGSHGGGAVWTPLTVDASAGVVYASVGNPSPDFYGQQRPGGDPYTDGVVALDLRTGALLWFGPEVSHDLWDYDAASPPVLFPLPHGQVGVGEAGKVGLWFEWNGRTGAALAPPLAFVREDHTPPTAAGTVEWPGTWGGDNYGPVAYDPLDGLAFIGGIELPQLVKGAPQAHSPGTADFGTVMGDAPGYQGTGSVTAVDVASGARQWQTSLPSPPLGGVTATAGGLVLVGTVAGNLYGLDARTGAIAWTQNLGANIGTAPIVYADGGRTYLVVTTGGGGMAGAPRHDAVEGFTLG